jgi:hypothetical protein
MPGNNAQQARCDSAYLLVRPAADQASFTLCFPADYSESSTMTVSSSSMPPPRRSARAITSSTEPLVPSRFARRPRYAWAPREGHPKPPSIRGKFREAILLNVQEV